MSYQAFKQLIQSKKTPFEWGKNDCFCFLFDWLYLQYGIDYRNKYKYDSKKTALREYRKQGITPEIFFSREGFKLLELAPENLRQGDILIQESYIPNVLIFFQGYFWSITEQKGLEHFMTQPESVYTVWRK